MSDVPQVTICAHCVNLLTRRPLKNLKLKKTFSCLGSPTITNVDLVQGKISMGHKNPLGVNDGECPHYSPINALFAAALAAKKAEIAAEKGSPSKQEG